MEEILASIRRIISDDESSSAQASPASASQQGGETVEAQEGEADERIIGDIARVLSDTAPAVEDEEDILDLTAELGGPEPVEEAAPVETPEAESVQPELEAGPPVVAEAPPAEVEAPSAAAPEPPTSASEEAASALERAIAALRAGQVPTSVAEFMPAPEPSVSPEPEAADQPEPSSALEPEAALEIAPEPEPDTIPEPEKPMVTSEFAAEVVVEETVEIEASPTESAEEPQEEVAAPEEPASWMDSSAPLGEPERQAARGNGEHGASPLDTDHKTLEDSVKDLLRPMLKQWLDENMPRVLTAALKDELGDTGPRRRQGD